MAPPAEQHGDIELFIRLDRVGTALSIVFVIIVNGLFLQANGIWLVVPLLALLILALFGAEERLGSQRTIPALALVGAGNWLFALVVPVLLPFLWPVMVLTVMMPLVLASPHLSRRQVMPAIVMAAAVTAAVATIGLLNDDGGVIDDIDDAVELVVVIGALSAQIVPIGLVVWQHNQMQRSNVGTLQLVNADLVESEAALAASRNRVVQAADTERRRIERDLHDGAQQRLVALGMRLRLLQSQVHDDPVTGETVDTLINELDGAVTEIRELAHGIYPPLLQIRGLPDAISAIARRSVQHVSTDIEPIARLPEPIETALYFTALEALANAAKHAGDSTIRLSLRQHHGDLVLQINDDGHGFALDQTAQSHGFDNMRDRLAVVGGHLVVDSTVGIGTTVTATVPHPS